MEICTGMCVDITDLINEKESNKLNLVYELYFLSYWVPQSSNGEHVIDWQIHN